MKWKLVQEDNVHLIKSEDGNTVCYIDKSAVNAYGKIIEKSMNMYAAILDYMQDIEKNKFQPKKTYNRFKEIIDRIED